MSKKIQFDYYKEDWIAFSIYHFSNNPNYSKAFRSNLFSIALLIVSYSVLIIVFGEADLSKTLFAALVMILTLILVSVVNRSKRMRKNFVDLISETGNEYVFGSYFISFFEDSVKIEGPASEEILQGKGMVKIKENEDYIFLYTSSFTGFVLPKVAFDQPQQIIRQLNLIKEKSEQT